MASLGEFRRLAASRHFAYGVWDCGLFCAEWVRLVRGVDPAAAWRGRYSTGPGLARLLKRRGGIVAHFDDCLAGVGIFRVGSQVAASGNPGNQFPELASGDIAVVETPNGLTGGIIAGPTILLAGELGLVVRHRAYALTVAAWSV